VQVALYDGSQEYDSCAGCTGVFGWDPVQGGDRWGHGSPVIQQDFSSGSLYVKVQPVQWYPDDKGGGQSQAVPADMYFEQWIYPIMQSAAGFRVHYKLTHFGGDTHSNANQEFPAVYVNLGFDRLVQRCGHQFTGKHLHGHGADLSHG
jgi:hypothetical protein